MVAMTSCTLMIMMMMMMMLTTTTTMMILILIIIIIFIIPIMLDIHTYIPETNHVSRVYSGATVLRILLMVHITLSSILNSFVLLH
jgi:hypothetical protein